MNTEVEGGARFLLEWARSKKGHIRKREANILRFRWRLAAEGFAWWLVIPALAVLALPWAVCELAYKKRQDFFRRVAIRDRAAELLAAPAASKKES